MVRVPPIGPCSLDRIMEGSSKVGRQTGRLLSGGLTYSLEGRRTWRLLLTRPEGLHLLGQPQTSPCLAPPPPPLRTRHEFQDKGAKPQTESSPKVIAREGQGRVQSHCMLDLQPCTSGCR